MPISGTTYRVDPVSVRWEPAAAHALERARAARGEWWGTRLADPTPEQVARWAREGIDVLGPDTARYRAARSRWARAFVRAVYRMNGGSRSIQVEIGRKYPQRGVIPAGRYMRIRVRRGGSAAMRAVGRLPDRDRIWLDDGTPGKRFADPADRDWT